MLVYIFPYLFLVLFSFLYYRIEEIDIPKPLLLTFFLTPAILIAILRGDVGTDTVNYIQYFKDLSEKGESTQTFEPGFEFISKFLVLTGLDERTCVAIISLITIMIFIKTFSNSKLNMLLFAIIVFPSYYYDMTMNGIRYGLSFAIACLAVDYLYKNSLLKFIILGICAVSIQYSSFLILIVFILFKLKTRYLVVISLMILASVPFLTTMIDFLFAKQEAYVGAPTPSAASGLGPLFICFCLYISYIYYARHGVYGKVIHAIFLLEVFSFYIAKLSYAGLRLQALFGFTMIVYIKNEIDAVKKKKEFLLILLCFGLLSLGLWLKNYSGDVEEVEAPYIPYKFFWQ